MSDKKEFDRDSISNTLIVAIGLSLVCSIIVSSAAIVLKPVQAKNEELFRKQIILDVAGLIARERIGSVPLDRRGEHGERLVEFATGGVDRGQPDAVAIGRDGRDHARDRGQHDDDQPGDGHASARGPGRDQAVGADPRENDGAVQQG